MKLKITTDNTPRPIIFGDDLTQKERDEFAYAGSLVDTALFFRARGKVYKLDWFYGIEFVGDYGEIGYDAYFIESEHTTVLIKFTDNDEVIVGITQ